MSGSINKVMLIGNLGRDPETRNFQNGGRVCNLRIATSETWKDRNTGDRRERVEWHSVAIFADPLITIAQTYLRKGSKVFIEGRLETRKWQDQSGQDRYSTEVALRPFQGALEMLGDPRGEDGPSQGSAPPQTGSQGYSQGRDRQDRRQDQQTYDDEIPF